MKWIVALLGAALLAGCGTTPKVGPWGYDIALTRIEDVRPVDDTRLMAVEAFNPAELIAAWARVTTRNVWSAAPAQAALRVTRYEATHSGHSYAMSLQGELVVSRPAHVPHYRDSARQLLARLPVSCMVHTTSSGGVGRAAILGQTAAGLPGGRAVRPQGEGPVGLAALTAQSRDAILWERLWTECAHSFASQLGAQLLSPSPR